MRIVVIGNYQSTNIGDDMYVEILSRQYPDHQIIPQHRLREDTRPNFLIYGGGGVLREAEGRRDLLHAWRKKYDCPYCVLSVGSSVGGALVFDENPFPDAEFITVRDEVSLKALPGSILVPDLAWTFKPPEKKSEIINHGTGIMLRHSNRFNSFHLVERVREELATLDDHYLFFSTYGQRLGDRTLSHTTRAGFPSTFDLYNGSNPAEYLEHYRSCRRVLVMPLHGIIFAAIYGVPWAAWSYSPKVDWLIQDLNAIVPASLKDNLTWNETPRELVTAFHEEAQRHFSLLDPYLK